MPDCSSPSISDPGASAKRSARPPRPATAPIGSGLALGAGLALLLSGCAGTGSVPVPTAKHVEYAGRNGQATSLDALTLGRKLYIRRCSACHNLKRPESLAAADWPDMVERMAANAELKPDQQRAITQYLVGVAAAAQDTSKTLPVPSRTGVTPIGNAEPR